MKHLIAFLAFFLMLQPAFAEEQGSSDQQTTQSSENGGQQGESQTDEEGEKPSMADFCKTHTC